MTNSQKMNTLKRHRDETIEKFEIARSYVRNIRASAEFRADPGKFHNEITRFEEKMKHYNEGINAIAEAIRIQRMF